MSSQTFGLRLLFKLATITFCFFVLNLVDNSKKVLAKNAESETFLSPAQIQIETKSQFEKKLTQKKQRVPFNTVYQKDSNFEWGKIVKSQAGALGENLIITETLFWKGKEVGKNTYTKKILQPQPQINLIGTKLTPGVIETSIGKLAYKGKLRVFATSYDKNCRGCNETTATGAKLTYGIAAVDPEIIPLGSRLYIPGYGFATAADVGGTIKGAKIDLAFDDLKNGFWRSRWTEVYLLE